MLQKRRKIINNKSLFKYEVCRLNTRVTVLYNSDVIVSVSLCDVSRGLCVSLCTLLLISYSLCELWYWSLFNIFTFSKHSCVTKMIVHLHSRCDIKSLRNWKYGVKCILKCWQMDTFIAKCRFIWSKNSDVGPHLFIFARWRVIYRVCILSVFFCTKNALTFFK